MLARTMCFIGIAFGSSWMLWFFISPFAQGQAAIALATIYMFGPLLGALATARLFDPGKVGAMIGWRWRVNRWWAIGWVLAGALTLGAALLASLLPWVDLQPVDQGAVHVIRTAGAELSPEAVDTLPSLSVLILLAMLGGILPNAIAGFGEEAGWRGYLWTVLRPLGFWRASGLIGLIWGLWHTPLIIAGHNYGSGYFGFPWSGVLMMTAFCLGLSPVMGFLRDRTGSSVPAAIFHGTINSMSGITLFMLAGAEIWSMGIIGVPGLGVLALVSFLLLLTGHGRRLHRMAQT